MFERGIFAAFAALLVSATLVGNADAYPTTARSGTTTVTRVYSPLNLQLDVIDNGLSKFNYVPSASPGQTFAFTGALTGRFSSTYNPVISGTAGSWTLNLGFNYFNTHTYLSTDTSAPILSKNNTDIRDSNNGSDTIKLRITGNDRPVGTLVYNSGLLPDIGTGPLPAEDQPFGGDMFLLYAKSAGDVFTVTVNDIENPTVFNLALAQDLLHLGPFIKDGKVSISEGEGTALYDQYKLDNQPLFVGSGITRVNPDCLRVNEPRRCGGVPSDEFSVAGVGGGNVPEPASLALVGVALAGLAVVRRRQQALRNV